MKISKRFAICKVLSVNDFSITDIFDLEEVALFKLTQYCIEHGGSYMIMPIWQKDEEE